MTGWALDDVGVSRVDIFRSSIAGEPAGLLFVGRAVFIRGARPDVQALFPNAADNDNAGWGFMVLTNFLPNQGNGTFDLHAYAVDGAGLQTLLGTRRIVAANATSVKPFGTIDTPGQGETVSGTIVNFGWALTPQPNDHSDDGSTINVYVDGVLRGHPVYNNNRADIAGLFPGSAQQQRRGRILHARYDDAHERPAHHPMGGHRQRRADVGGREPVLPRAERFVTVVMRSSRRGCHGVVRKELVEGNPEAHLEQPASKASRLSRRALLGLGALGAAARAEAQVRAPKTLAADHGADRRDAAPAPCRPVGVTTEDVAWMNALGYYGYLEWQLNPEAMGDPDCEAALAPLPRRSPWPRSRSISSDSAILHPAA